MKKLILTLIGLAFCANITLAQTNSSVVATPLLNTPKFESMTNWFSKAATSIQVSGVYTITLKNHKPQGGGVATMWGFIDEDIDANFHVKAGPVALLTLQEQECFAGVGATGNIVPNSNWEQKLNQWPVTGTIARFIRWSDLYLFLTVGCQVDKENPFIGLGGGIRCW